MTISNVNEAYVWIWLPQQSEPVVAGKIIKEKKQYHFFYGQSYLERNDAISLFNNELPLEKGVQIPKHDLMMAGCLRDASPDAWGRRVIMNRHLGEVQNSSIELDELIYLLESGSDRIGMLDFQSSATEYKARGFDNPTLEELLESADRIEKGLPINPDLDRALLHGSSVGGARPKSQIQTDHKKYIAKFPLSTDIYNVVKAEYIAMQLAKLSGLNVPNTLLKTALGKDVLLIERFDREHSETGWYRKGMLSALTLLQLDEMQARYASYEDLAEIIRLRFDEPKTTLHELFSRLTFNILCGNTDDHARNHAAFWDGHHLRLTPAYDICPQQRTGQESSQAMRIIGIDNHSRYSTCLNAAHNFMLDIAVAKNIILNQINVFKTHWQSVCDQANLSEIERNLFLKGQYLNPFAYQDLKGAHDDIYEACEAWR